MNDVRKPGAASDAWWIFRGRRTPEPKALERLPEAPPWRRFPAPEKPPVATAPAPAPDERGAAHVAEGDEIEMVNVALYLRRPLLITGRPGTGKTSLAYAVAHELGLGRVLRWSITTRSTLQQGLYDYDAVGRLQAVAPGDGDGARIEDYLRLGPLGTALASPSLRVLLIDEIDKSDIDLPNDLLHVFEEGSFSIPPLERLAGERDVVPVPSDDPDGSIEIRRGRVQAASFPFVVLTSNGERDFPPAFLRRCVRLELAAPDEDKLAQIVRTRFFGGGELPDEVTRLLEAFVARRDQEQVDVATDQLLNAIWFVLHRVDPLERGRETLLDVLWRSLSESDRG